MEQAEAAMNSEAAQDSSDFVAPALDTTLASQPADGGAGELVLTDGRGAEKQVTRAEREMTDDELTDNTAVSPPSVSQTAFPSHEAEAGGREDEEGFPFASATHGASHLPSFVAASAAALPTTSPIATIDASGSSESSSSTATISSSLSSEASAADASAPSAFKPALISPSSAASSILEESSAPSSSSESSSTPTLAAEPFAPPDSTSSTPAISSSLSSVLSSLASSEPASASSSSSSELSTSSAPSFESSSIPTNAVSSSEPSASPSEPSASEPTSTSPSSGVTEVAETPTATASTSSLASAAPAEGSAAQDQSASGQKQPPRGSEVFVGGLGKDVNEADLYNLFASIGEIFEIRLMKDSATGESKGYGFVRFTSPKFAKRAVQQIDGAMLKGRKIGVVHSNDNQTLFLGHLDKDWRQEQLEQHLRDAKIKGVVNITLMKDTTSMRGNRGFAFVEFGTHEEAAKAHAKIMKPGFKLGNVEVKVDWAEPLNEPSEEVMSKVKSIYVCNLPVTVDDELIMKLFSEFGEIERIVLSKNLKSARRDDFAFVNYTDRAHALAAIEARNGYKIDDEHILEVTLAKPVSEQEKQAGKQAGRQDFSAAGRGGAMRGGHRGGPGFGPSFGGRGGDFHARGGYRDHRGGRGDNYAVMRGAADRRGGRGGRGGRGPREWDSMGYPPQYTDVRDFHRGAGRDGRRQDQPEAYGVQFERPGGPVPTPSYPPPAVGGRGGYGFRGGHRGGAVAGGAPVPYAAEPAQEFEPHGRKRRLGEGESKGPHAGAGAFQRTTRHKPDEQTNWTAAAPPAAQPPQGGAATWTSPAAQPMQTMPQAQQPYRPTATVPTTVPVSWQQPTGYAQPTQPPIYIGYTPPTAYSAMQQAQAYAQPQQTAYAMPQTGYAAPVQQPVAYSTAAVPQQPAVYGATPQQQGYAAYPAQPYSAVQAYGYPYATSGYYAAPSMPAQTPQGQQRPQQ